MQDKKSIQKFFQTQSITIRKGIREMDMGYENEGVISQPRRKSDINILVVGPVGSGKSTLLRTMHYALNGSLSCMIEKRNIGEASFDRFQIKRNRRCAIEGLTKLKQTDQKLGVYGYQINFHALGLHYASPMDKYARAVQLMNNRSLGCISHSMSSSGLGAINYVIVCLSMVQKLSKEEMIALRFFICEMEEKKIKFNIVGTHLDQILGRQSTHNTSFTSNYSNNEQEKMVYIESWKKLIAAELCPKISVDIFCMENYANILNKQQFENSQAINYYSLILLDNCIKKAPESEKPKKISLKLFCF